MNLQYVSKHLEETIALGLLTSDHGTAQKAAITSPPHLGNLWGGNSEALPRAVLGMGRRDGSANRLKVIRIGILQ